MKPADRLPVSQQSPGHYPMPVESHPHSYTYIPVLLNYYDPLKCTFCFKIQTRFCAPLALSSMQATYVYKEQ